MGQWQSQPVCNAPACLHVASTILKNLAPNWAEMDPCTEFDKMVCYGYGEHNDEDTSATQHVQERNNRIIKKILESSSHKEAAGIESTFINARSANEEHNFDMLRTVYQSCMDVDAIALLGVKPMTELIVKLNKTWPVSPGDVKTKITPKEYPGLAKAALSMLKIKVPAFIGAGVQTIQDPLESNTTLIVVQFPNPGFSNESAYSDPEVIKLYTEKMAKVFEMVYPDLDEEAATDLADAVVSFEAGIIDVIATASKDAAAEGATSADDTFFTTPVADLVKSAPAVGFDTLITGLTQPAKTPSTAYVQFPDAWADMSQLIADQSKAALQGWMVWKMVNDLHPYVEAPELKKVLGMRSSTASRFETCKTAVDQSLRHMLDHYYIAVTYPDRILKTAEELTSNLRTQFKKRLGELPWMSQQAKQRAIKKVDNMVQNIGYKTDNPNLRDSDSLASYYDGLNFTTSYFANTLAGREHATAKTFEEATKPTDRHSFVNHATSEVNAFYSANINAIVINAGISQLPLFHYDLPDYALYGAFGSFIGHELSHGFDNTGSTFDENAERRDWWDNSTVTAYAERQKCFVEQYSAYEMDVPGGKQHVDGKKTLGENLSDAGGLHAAWDAWIQARKSKPKTWDQDLPGLDKFTHEQLFFLFYGNTWCESLTPASNKQQLDNPKDNHSPNRYRLLGGALNSRGFREAFKCKVKEPQCEAF